MMLAKFRQRYPQGSLVSELIEIDRGFYIVKVSVQVDRIVLATGLAGASTIEAAEDSARERAIAVVLSDGEAIVDSTVNNTSNLVDRTSLKEPITQINSNEPEREIVNLQETETPIKANEPEEISLPEPTPPRSESILEPRSEPRSEPEPSTPQSNLFSGTFTMPTETSIIEPESVEVVDSTPAIATLNSEEMDFNEIKQKTDIEIKRLGWTKDNGREFLKSRYGKRSRLHLTDEQLLEFLQYLEQQPTPAR